MSQAIVSIGAMTDQLRALGVRDGGVLLVHTAFRAVRPVEDGIAGLVAALRAAIGPLGTLVTPSATGDDDHVFDPATTPPAADLGAVPDWFRRRPGVLRSAHFDAYAAIGPAAAQIVATPLALPPSAPGGTIDRIRELGGQVLLLGCGHEANTTAHLAELVGGAPYRLRRHFIAFRDGAPVRVDYGENDHCCRGFGRFDDWLRAEGLQRDGVVGHAPARLMAAEDVVRIGSAKVARDPLIFLCIAGAGCDECDVARASVRG